MLIRKVVADALCAVKDRRAVLAKALSLPLTAYVISGLLAESVNDTPVEYLVFLIDLIIQTIVAVITHRIILMGPDSVSDWGLRAWTKRETAFLMHVVGLLAFVSASIWLPVTISFLPIFLIPISVLLSFWVWCRVSLVFPSIATDNPLSFSASWRLTKNHQLLMCCVVIVLPIVLVLPTYAIEGIPFSSILTNLYFALTIVMNIAVLSLAYDAIWAESSELGSKD